MSGAVKDPLRALQGARSRAQGGQLEERIEASCTRLAEAGRADISKTPEPMRPVSQPNKTGQFRAVYTKKAEPDFKGVMLGGRAVMFEAKSTGTGRLNKDRVLPEQAKKLDSYEALGAHCNGDMHAALDYASKVKHAQREVVSRCGIKSIVE